MKLALLGAVAALCLSACAYGPGLGPGPMGFDAYYDGAYGPFDDGYWGDDGGFYYASGPDHHFLRDEGHHFSHVAANGMNGVHFRGGVDHTGAPHFSGGGHAGGGDRGHP